MAEKGLTVRMKTDTSGFKKGMDEVVEELNKYNKALVDNQYKQRDCNKVINDAKKRIKELNEIQKEKGKLDENEENELKKLTDTIEEEKVKLSQLRTEQASLRNVISQTTQSLTENEKGWSVLKGTLANLASDTLKKLGSELVNIARDVVQTGEQFSASMSEVGAISGATADELAELEQAARLYGATTKFSATEAADALKYMALAGWDSQQAIAGLPAVLDLAAASGMDLGRASDIVTDYITAFGLEVEDASRFVDIMSYAMSNSNTTTEMLGEAYKNCAATAKSMGFSVEETTSALMTMANAGVKGGEAGTTLNTLMTRLATNTKGCADELKKYGVKIYDSQGNMHSLSEIMNGLISAFETLTQKEQANLSKMIAGTNQYAGFQTLMQGMSEKVKEAGMSFEDYTAALEQCEGTSNDMAKTMSNNLTGDLKTLESALDELKLKLFDSAETPLRNIVQAITEKGVPAIETLINHLNIIIPVVVSAATAMAAYKATLAITSIINGVRQGLAKLTAAKVADTTATIAETNATVAETTATQGATVAQNGFNAALSANPIGLVIGLLGGLISLLVTFSLTTQKATKASDDLNNSLNSLNSAKESAENRIGIAQGEAEIINVLGKRYDELRTKVDKTKEDYQELSMISAQLAERLGISTEEIRTQTGEYKDLSKEIENATQQMVDQAKVKALGDLITEATQARYKAREAYDKQLKKLVDEGIYYYDKNGKAILDSSKLTTKELQNEAVELAKLSEIYHEADGIVENYSAELEELNKQIAEKTAKTEDDGKKVDETSSKIEATVKKTETLSEKYKRLNSLLEENERAVKAVNAEIEQAMDSGDTAHLEELQKKLKELNSENTALQSRIKAVKDEIEKDANAIADAIENVESSMQMLQKAEKEVADNGKLSLNTLNSIQKKYPELIDLVNEYISGVKTEKDIIAGLKEVYEKDADNYNQALAFKKLKQDSYNNEFASASAELVNKYKDHYGIDLKNFISVNEAKKAALDELKAKAEQVQQEFDNFWEDNNFADIHNGRTGKDEYFIIDSINKTSRRATNEEIARYKEILAKRNQAFDDYYDFDESAFQKKLEEDLKKYYNPVSADSLLELSGSGNSSVSNSGGSSGKNDNDRKKNTVTLSGYDVTATGDTYAKAYMTWVDRLKSLGKITEQGEIYYLEKLKERTDNTAEEIYQIDLKLYQARQKLADDSAKSLAEIEKKRQDELQEKLNFAKAAYERLVNGRIESLQKEAQAAKDTADAEIAALDKVLAKRKQAKADEDRQKKIDYINAQLRYKQLDEFSRNELQRQKQDLLNEQAEANFERNITAKQQAISQNATLAQNKTQQAINGLNSAKSQFADHIAYLSGSQTYDQRVANNTVNQNIQIVQNSLSTDQLYRKFLKETGLI